MEEEPKARPWLMSVVPIKSRATKVTREERESRVESHAEKEAVGLAKGLKRGIGVELSGTSIEDVAYALLSLM